MGPTEWLLPGLIGCGADLSKLLERWQDDEYDTGSRKGLGMITDKKQIQADKGWQTPVAMIIGVGVLFRLLVAIFLPLGVDEAHALAVAREFSWAFFDHPPIGFWAPVVAAKLTGLETPLVLRIPHLLFGAGSLWMIYLIGRQLGGQRGGCWSAALFGLTPAFALAGVFILPDGPLMFFGAIAVYWLVRIVKDGEKAGTAQWIFAGLALALALMSKYHAALIPISTLIFAASTRQGRRWFLTPGPYLASAIGLIGLMPVIWWNMQNDWASFTFQTGRTGQGLNLLHFGRMLVAQVIYLLPPVFVVAIPGIGASLNKRDPARLLVALIALGPILFFNLVNLFSNQSLPHWALPGWQYAMPLAGAWLAAKAPTARRRFAIWFGAFLVLAYALVLLAVLQIRTGALTRVVYDTPPSWDRTIDVFDYAGLRTALDKRGDLAGVDMIATPGWIEAGLVSAAFRGELPLRVLWTNPHHFGFMEGQRAGGEALLLVPAMLQDAPGQLPQLLDRARQIDPDARALSPVILKRGPEPYAAVNVIRLRLPPAGRGAGQ